MLVDSDLLRTCSVFLWDHTCTRFTAQDARWAWVEINNKINLKNDTFTADKKPRVLLFALLQNPPVGARRVSCLRHYACSLVAAFNARASSGPVLQAARRKQARSGSVESRAAESLHLLRSN